MFNIRNAVYVALMQIGVIVAGVLAAGLVFKMRQTANIPMPGPAAALLNHSFLFLLLPVGWTMVALLVRVRPECSEDTKYTAFWLGVFLLIGLVIFVGYADITPWLSGTWGPAADDS